MSKTDIDLLVKSYHHSATEHKPAAIKKLIDYCKSGAAEELAYYKTQLDRLITDNQTAFNSALGEQYITAELAELVLRRNYPLLKPKLFLMAYRAYRFHFRRPGSEDFPLIIEQSLQDQPEAINALSRDELEELLHILPADNLARILSALTGPISSSSSKTLRQAVTTATKKIPLTAIANAGWLAIKNKNMRLTCRDILMAHPDNVLAAQLLQQLIAASSFDAASTSSIIRHLKQLGVELSSSSSTDLNLANLEVQALQVKRTATRIKHYGTAEIFELMQPLSKKAAEVILHLAATGDHELPSLAQALLAHIPRQQRADLALQLLDRWLATEGAPNLSWALKISISAGDERVADLLAQTAITWSKTKTQRANTAVTYLFTMDTHYAIALGSKIINSNEVGDSVYFTARHANSRAQSRALVRLQMDESASDFGLGSGIHLSVGTNNYEILLQSDLSLGIKDRNEKITKSLPKNSDNKLKIAWEQANNQIKSLAVSIKDFHKQQTGRLYLAFIAGKTWPYESWRLQFSEHPLLKIICQSLIWQSIEDGRSFRIAEDLSLIDVNDDLVELSEHTQVRLWHPVDTSADDVAAWKVNLADYELQELFHQVDAPTALPPAEALKKDRILAPQALYITQEIAARLFKEWHYVEGEIYREVGRSIVTCHELPLTALKITAILNHGDYPTSKTRRHLVGIRDIQFIGDAPTAADLPKALLATLWQQMQTMLAYSTIRF